MTASRSFGVFILWGPEDRAAARIHASDESVDPSEIERMILAQDFLLQEMASRVSHHGPSRNGPFQPPRNRVAAIADCDTIPAYSVSRKNANRSPVYSVRWPKTSSESATGMSNGGRVSSAKLAIKKTTKATASHGSSTLGMVCV
jgi:hypothetical protein